MCISLLPNSLLNDFESKCQGQRFYLKVVTGIIDCIDRGLFSKYIDAYYRTPTNWPRNTIMKKLTIVYTLEQPFNFVNKKLFT